MHTLFPGVQGLGIQRLYFYSLEGTKPDTLYLALLTHKGRLPTASIEAWLTARFAHPVKVISKQL